MHLYREVERHYPHLLRRVIFLTGDTLSTENLESLEQVGALVLSKPFHITEVQSVIQRALHGA
jgi:DNA-binding response OmpR family regulator